MNTTIIVLGMHRSGTSCLAGILEKAGVHFGDVSKYNSFNINGNRENPRIMKLHESILAYNKSAWDNPPMRIEWTTDHKNERESIVRGFKDTPIWGFKDPRTLLLLEGWMETLQNVSLVATFRHPSHVAQSLIQRNNFPLEKSLTLWKIYNEKLLDYHEKYHFPVVSFDLPPNEYSKKIGKLLNVLNLNIENNPTEFYNAELRHHVDTPLYNPPCEFLEIHEKLNRITL